MANGVTVLNAGFTWQDPTLNTNGTTTASGGLSGYNIGVRAVGSSTVTANPPGTYPNNCAVSGATATSLTTAAFLAAVSPQLVAGTYFAAVQAVGVSPNEGIGAWSSEVEFVIPAPTPNPPANFTVA